MIESDERSPYASTEDEDEVDDYYYDNRSYYNTGNSGDRQSSRRNNYSRQDNSSSVELSYDGSYYLGYATHRVVGCCGGSVEGTIKDEDMEEGLPFATVFLKQNGLVIYSTQADFDGRYSMPSVDSGTYQMVVTGMGYKTYQEEFVLGNNINSIEVYIL